MQATGIDTTDRRLAHRLDREWRHLAVERRAVRRADGWAVVAHRVGDLDRLLACAGYGLDDGARCSVCGDGDAVLRRLVGLAANDQLAGRIVLQRVLPGLRHRAHRWSGGPARLDADSALGELLGAAWPLIRTYDLDRPGLVAVNLVRDSTHAAFVAPKRRRVTREQPTDPETFSRTPVTVATSPCAELAELLVEARAAGLDGDELKLLGELVAADGSTEQLARRDRVTTRAIRYRRTRILRRLRAYALRGTVTPSAA